MFFTIHVIIGKVWHLLDCGLSTAEAADLAIALEEQGYEFRIDLAGSASEPVGSPLVYIAQVARVRSTSSAAGRCAA